MVEVLRKEVPYGFDDAVKRAEDLCKKHGFGLLLTKAIDEIFKKELNLPEYPRYTIVLACVPKLAHMALDVSKNVGTLFPCSFVVYEENGKTFVSHTSIMKVASETGLGSKEGMAPVIQETGKYVHAVWDEI